jgi:hypothetical protein
MNHYRRLRLMYHTVTLAKSRKDAEEERQERTQIAMERNRHDYNVATETVSDADVMLYLDDADAHTTAVVDSEMTTVEEYLQYENPFLSRRRSHHAFVAEALASAHCNGILSLEDTLSLKREIVSSSNNGNNVEFRVTVPDVVEGALERYFEDKIKAAVSMQRQHRSTASVCCTTDYTDTQVQPFKPKS